MFLLDDMTPEPGDTARTISTETDRNSEKKFEKN